MYIHLFIIHSVCVTLRTPACDMLSEAAVAEHEMKKRKLKSVHFWSFKSPFVLLGCSPAGAVYTYMHIQYYNILYIMLLKIFQISTPSSFQHVGFSLSVWACHTARLPAGVPCTRTGLRAPGGWTHRNSPRNRWPPNLWRCCLGGNTLPQLPILSCGWDDEVPWGWACMSNGFEMMTRNAFLVTSTSLVTWNHHPRDVPSDPGSSSPSLELH